MNKKFLPLLPINSHTKVIVKHLVKNYPDESLTLLVKAVYFIKEAGIENLRACSSDTSSNHLVSTLNVFSLHYEVTHKDFSTLGKVIDTFNFKEPVLGTEEVLINLAKLYNTKYAIDVYVPKIFNYMAYAEPKKILSDIPKYIKVFKDTRNLNTNEFTTKEELEALILEGIFNKKDKIGVKYVETNDLPF